MTTVLLSGGLDSAVCLYRSLHRNENVQAVTIDYGQRHRREISAAHEIARSAGVPWRRVFASATAFGIASPLAMGGLFDYSKPPVMPGRNLVLLSIAAAFAAENDGMIVVGSCADDQRDFPDCRPAFFAAAEIALSLALDTKVRVVAPLIDMEKPEIVTMATRLGPGAVGAAKMSWSCYDPRPEPCGECGACELRAKSGVDRLPSPRVGS